jgi:hypothetical protein
MMCKIRLLFYERRVTLVEMKETRRKARPQYNNDRQILFGQFYFAIIEIDVMNIPKPVPKLDC